MEPEESANQCYSVQFRLRRVTIDYCYVNVPVTHDLMILQPDGSGRLDVDTMVKRAAEISMAEGVNWYFEGKEVEPHPIQKPMEPGEERFQGPFPPDVTRNA